MKTPALPEVREVTCKSILVKSGICDYAVNCYTGCQNACVYCYARFASRFKHGQQPWGSFVDVKINAPEVLRKQLARPRTYPGTVFLSSVCDGWQRLEEKYQLTRACLAPLLDAGFELHILTKRTLVERDFDILAGRPRVEVGLTVTCADESLRKFIEPDASPTADRIETLRRAAKAGIPTSAFIGPLMPGITDTPENIEALVAALATTEIRYAYADRLNLRWGVWPALSAWVRQHRPALLPHVKAALWSAQGQQEYAETLRKRLTDAARKAGLKAEIRLVC
jgi:DNA repair photolyase